MAFHISIFVHLASLEMYLGRVRRSDFLFNLRAFRCGGVGHVTKDCKQRRPGEIWNQSAGGAELDGNYIKGISWIADGFKLKRSGSSPSFAGKPSRRIH